MAAATADAGLMTDAKGQPLYAARPAKNVQLIFLRDDADSLAVLKMLSRVCRDHGLSVKEFDTSKGLLTAQAPEGSTKEKMEITFRTGHHQVRGNMLVCEFNQFIGERVGKWIAVIAVIALVVVVAVVASNASGGHHSSSSSSSSGGGGGHHHHHHHHCRSTPVIFYSPVVYRTPRIQRTTIVVQGTSDQVTPCQSFKSRTEFFEYFFSNLTNFFANQGLVRVPDEGLASLGAQPLNSSRIFQSSLWLMGIDLYVFNVPAWHPDELPPTLQVDVMADGPIILKARNGKQPSQFSSDTVTGQTIGQDMYLLQVGPNTNPPIAPGYWYISVSHGNTIKSVSYKVGAIVYDSAAKVGANPALLGASSARTVSEEGDEWELIELEQDPAETSQQSPLTSLASVKAAAPQPTGGTASASATASAPPAWTAPPSTDTLTRSTDLLALTENQLRSECQLRGLDTQGLDNTQMAASLWQVLPNGTNSATAPVLSFATAPPAPDAEAPPTPTDDDSVIDDEAAPHAFRCPITMEVMKFPVSAADGFSYEENAIAEWLATNDTSPMTGAKLPHRSVVPNLTLRSLIQTWMQEQTATAAAPGDAASPPTDGGLVQ